MAFQGAQEGSGGRRSMSGSQEEIVHGVKVCQNTRNHLIFYDKSGLQSRLRRFDSDRSLENAVACVSSLAC